MHMIPSNFWQWLNSFQPGDRGPLFLACLSIVSLLVLLVVAIVSFTVYKVHKNRLNDALKRDMLERGISPDEIVEIIAATPGTNRSLGV